MDTSMMEKLDELRQRLIINQYDLDDECVSQPALYDEVGQLAVEARGNSREKKNALEFTRANLSSTIRKNPEVYVSGKVTEGSIEAAIIMNLEYRKALDEYESAQRVSDAFIVLQAAVEQRKSMIKDLTSLFVYSYFSSMQTSGMDKERVKSRGEVTSLDDIAKYREQRFSNQMTGDDDIPEEIED
jgi:hypothetical protein